MPMGRNARFWPDFRSKQALLQTAALDVKQCILTVIHSSFFSIPQPEFWGSLATRTGPILTVQLPGPRLTLELSGADAAQI